MKYWPVPHSTVRNLPESGKQGSFWEDRGDRHHAGVDLYAPTGSDVVAIEAGNVIEVKQFTSPLLISYWNITVSVLVQTAEGKILRYAEMSDSVVSKGDHLEAGQLIGHVGMVLDPDKIDSTSPAYIQRLKNDKLPSMLHFEIHSCIPLEENYLGGNYFTTQKPAGLLDPTGYLASILDPSRG